MGILPSMTNKPYTGFETWHFELHKTYWSTKCLLGGKIHKGKGVDDEALVV